MGCTCKINGRKKWTCGYCKSLKQPAPPTSTPLATVTRRGALDMQVCVPEGWSDAKIKSFADQENMCGTVNGWQIRTDPQLLNGSPARNPCANGLGMVHVTLDA